MMNKKTITVVAVIAIALIGIISAYFILSNQSGVIKAVNEPGIKKVSKEFLNKMHGGNFEEARLYLSSAGQKEYGIEKLKQIKIPQPTYETKPEIMKDEASIVYGDKPTKRYVNLSLVKENGDWKISKIESYILEY